LAFSVGIHAARTCFASASLRERLGAGDLLHRRLGGRVPCNRLPDGLLEGDRGHSCRRLGRLRFGLRDGHVGNSPERGDESGCEPTHA
jgi:hypothetical protein